MVNARVKLSNHANVPGNINLYVGATVKHIVTNAWLIAGMLLK
jgi:hypothetical protein